MKPAVFLATIISLGIVLAGCAGPIDPSGTTGTLSVSIADGVSRSLLPSISMNPSSYHVEGIGPGGATFSATISDSASVTIDKLAFGTWTLTVTANNAAGTAIGEGTGTAIVHSNETTSVAVTVVPYSGFGALSLGLAWTSSDLDVPQVEAYLLPAAGSARILDFSVNASNGNASWSGSDIANGYYTLTLKLNDNGALAMGAVEVVRIVKDETTIGNFIFDQVNKPGGNLAVDISPELGDDLTVNITGAFAIKAADQTMSLNASIAEGGLNATFVWYVNGDARGTGPDFALDSSWVAGFYRIDTTAYSSDGMRAGSATYFIEVSEDAPIPIEPIEIAGSWTMDSWGFLMTVTSSSVFFDYPTIAADLIEFDNDANFMVLYFSAHPVPEFVGKYVQIAWRNRSALGFVADIGYPSVDAASAGEAPIYASTTCSRYDPTKTAALALAKFDATSYHPIVAGASWTYSNGNSVTVSMYDEAAGTFVIANSNGTGSMFGSCGWSGGKAYASYAGFSGPNYLPVHDYFGFTPLIFEDSALVSGFSWSDYGNSNGYIYNQSMTITEVGVIKTTPEAVYNDCVVLTREITYPNGYDWSRYLRKVTYYLARGIGFVYELREWSDGSTSSLHLMNN